MKTLLFLNIQGSMLVMLLLLLKRIIYRSFSGKAQRILWFFVAVMFLLPVWKAVPTVASSPVIVPHYEEVAFTYENVTAFTEETTRNLPSDRLLPKTNIVPLIWVTGVCGFLILNIISYMLFIIRMRNSSKIAEDKLFSDMLQKMNIQRKIRLKRCADVDAPMLVGVLFPVVYVPESLDDEYDRHYVYQHELTHYKHKDLLLKWFVCGINAINWFNPFIYAVTKNINEACEIYCDEAVTRNLDDDGKKEYMNTILKLVRQKGEKHV